VLTILLVPNTGTLDLNEVDKCWRARVAGQPYDGPAIEYRHLSYVEAWLGDNVPTS